MANAANKQITRTTKKYTAILAAQNVYVKCIKCVKFYALPSNKDDYLAHLYLQHRLVIADVEDIALLADYLQYWENEFQSHELEEYCTTMLLDQLPDGTPAKNERYYLLSDILPQDFELRKRLQKKRLEAALTCHQFERTDRNFNKECLFCRDIITGLRAEYLHHLYNKHFLLLGKPENLVYVDELISKLEHNLEQLICLYCQNIFKDRVTLKEHMRKKGHKRINPNNQEYDKFFLISYYRETQSCPEKRKNQQRCRQQATRQPTNCGTAKEMDTESVDFEKHFARKGSDEQDSDWSDWAGEEQQPLKCLYCTGIENNYTLLKEHMLTEHDVDFAVAMEPLNFYQRIKVVNYVRRQTCLLRCVTCDQQYDSEAFLMEHLQQTKHCSIGTKEQWNKPEFFFPYLENDGLLCVLDDSPNEDIDDAIVRIISEDTVVQINKDAERLSLQSFEY